MKQNKKKRTQTLGSALNGLEIIFKAKIKGCFLAGHIVSTVTCSINDRHHFSNDWGYLFDSIIVARLVKQC